MRNAIDFESEKPLRERALEAKIAKLEKELEAERLKTKAYDTMIDIAEAELGIDIRKKLVPNSR